MRQLLPGPQDDVDPVVVHGAIDRPAPPGRPWVAVIMVASVDGATALAGVSGGLGNEADGRVFSALRAAADVILVGAETARADEYRAPRTAPEQRAARLDRGQEPFPRLAVVSRSLDLDPAGPMFTDLPPGPERPERPLIYSATSSPSNRRAALDEVAEVVDAGDDSVDVALVLADLALRNAGLALAEGGPTLLGHLLTQDLIDEVDVTTSPLLIGGPSARLMTGAGPGSPTGMTLAHLWEDDGFLLARYIRS